MVPVLCQSATHSTALGQAPQWLGLALVFVWLVLLILRLPVERLVFKAVGVLSFTLLLSVALGYLGEGGEFGDWTVNGAKALSCSTLVACLLVLGLPASFALATDWCFWPAYARNRAARALAAEPVVGTIGRYQVRGGYAHEGLGGGATVVETAEAGAAATEEAPEQSGAPAEQSAVVQDSGSSVELEAPAEAAGASAPEVAEEVPARVDPFFAAPAVAEEPVPPEPPVPEPPAPADVRSFLADEAAPEPRREPEPAFDRDPTLGRHPEPEVMAPVEEEAPWWARRRAPRFTEPVEERAPEMRAEAEEQVTFVFEPGPRVEPSTAGQAPPAEAVVEMPPAEEVVEPPPVEAVVEPPPVEGAMEEPAVRAGAEPPAAEPTRETPASQAAASEVPPPRTLSSEDQLFVQAGDCVVKAERASISFLQKSLGVGYFQAAKLLDRLEKEGVIGPYTGAVNREVLMNAARWQERRPV